MKRNYYITADFLKTCDFDRIPEIITAAHACHNISQEPQAFTLAGHRIQADKDDMENVTMYAAAEDPEDAWDRIKVAEDNDGCLTIWPLL